MRPQEERSWFWPKSLGNLCSFLPPSPRVAVFTHLLVFGVYACLLDYSSCVCVRVYTSSPLSLEILAWVKIECSQNLPKAICRDLTLKNKCVITQGLVFWRNNEHCASCFIVSNIIVELCDFERVDTQKCLHIGVQSVQRTQFDCPSWRSSNTCFNRTTTLLEVRFERIVLHFEFGMQASLDLHSGVNEEEKEISPTKERRFDRAMCKTSLHLHNHERSRFNAPYKAFAGGNEFDWKAFKDVSLAISNIGKRIQAPRCTNSS